MTDIQKPCEHCEDSDIDQQVNIMDQFIESGEFDKTLNDFFRVTGINKTKFEGDFIMGAAMKIDDPVDISFMLLMKYRKPVIKLEELLPDYLPHLTIEQANKRANKCTLPFPAFKSDGRNSPFYVHLSDVAFWLEAIQKSLRKTG